MKQLSVAAVQRAMKLQDVMLKAMAKRITWYQAAEILGISCRQMQREYVWGNVKHNENSSR